MRSVSFGLDAHRYDALRPGYPAAVVGAILGDGRGRVLDVGCGTGIASRVFAAAGCDVLGVEPDARMAEVAHARGTAVEVSTFEAWDARGRVFDAVVCAQAWWWLDRPAVIPKIVGLLAEGGRLAVLWNAGSADDELTRELSALYARVGPELREPMTSGASPDPAAELRESGLFGGVEESAYAWTRTYTSADWAQTAATFSDVIALPDDRREALLGEIVKVIDAHGGTRDVEVTTSIVVASPVGRS